MFKFLFGGGNGAAKKAAIVETQRQAIERTLKDLNELLASLPEKPSVSVNMNDGSIGLLLPEQMPDEAIALPAPKNETAGDSESAGDTDAAAEAVDGNAK